MRTKAPGKNAMIFVLLTVVINSIGFGILVPVLPDLIKELTGLDNSNAILDGMWLTFWFAAMQFIFMPIVGALSDRFGRRPVMLISLFGLSLDFFLMAYAPTILFLYAGRVIAGATGATFTTANAYIADISPPETRAQNFGLVGAAFGVGFMLGPVIGGILGEYGTRVPFFAAGVISLLNVAYGFFFLPETLAKEDRRPFEWKRANPFGALKSLGKIQNARGLIFVFFILAMAHTAYPSAYSFVMNEQLKWSEADIGYSLGAFGLASMIVQGGLIRIIIPKIGLFWAGVVGMFSASIAYAMMGLGTAGWVIYAAGPFAAFAGLYGPALNNMMSSRIGKSEQGELQGAIGAAQGLALMIGPFAMGISFNRFTGDNPPIYAPGAPFILASLSALVALAVYLVVTNKSDRKVQPKSDEVVSEAEGEAAVQE